MIYIDLIYIDLIYIDYLMTYYDCIKITYGSH